MSLALEQLPVLIIGSGPVGLAAAAKCVQLEIPFLVLEQGPRTSAAVREWAHVRLFSPWCECLDTDAVPLLETMGWRQPELSDYPDGGELVRDYLEPLAKHPAIAPAIRLYHRAIRIGRKGVGKTTRHGRFDAPFIVETSDGTRVVGRAVLDCSGTWSSPRGLPLGRTSKDGPPIFLGIPNFTDSNVRARLSGRQVLVIGAGHSAMTAICDFVAAGMHGGGASLVWIRRASEFEGKLSPPGSARRLLELRAEEAARRAGADVVQDFRVSGLSVRRDRVAALGEDSAGNAKVLEANAAIVSTGFRPDHRLAEELWLSIDHRWEVTPRMSALIDPERLSCSQVQAAGFGDLAHPERDYFILGAKSFGRAPNFALPIGYAQLDAVIPSLSTKSGKLTTERGRTSCHRCAES